MPRQTAALSSCSPPARHSGANGLVFSPMKVSSQARESHRTSNCIYDRHRVPWTRTCHLGTSAGRQADGFDTDRMSGPFTPSLLKTRLIPHPEVESAGVLVDFGSNGELRAPSIPLGSRRVGHESRHAELYALIRSETHDGGLEMAGFSGESQRRRSTGAPQHVGTHRAEYRGRRIT